MITNLKEPANAAELGEVLAGLAAGQKRIELGGCFSKRAMGGHVDPAAVPVSTRKLARVVEYQPSDLTISVEAGMCFGALETLLAENNQVLPLDPALAERATVGGVVAANCSGPRRRLYGSARDMVIGMTFVTLEGKEIRSGGMVVKNVAGLDMAKLLIGSFGTLAAISRVNFRVFPRPLRERTFLLAFGTPGAALKARDLILRGVLQPAATDLLNPAASALLGIPLPPGFLLAVEAGGIDAVLARYERELKTVARDAGASDFVALDPEEARPVWRGIRDFSAPDDAAVVRLSTTLARLGECFAAAESDPAAARAGNGIVYVRTADPGGFAARARKAGLYAVIESCASDVKDDLELWADPGPEFAIMSRIKETLDPHHLLNHGRLYNRL